MLKESDFIRVPVSDISTPKAGRICYPGSWWQVTDKDEVLFYQSMGSPQCNTNRSIVERLKQPFCKEVRFIEMAFLPHNCNDYV